MKTKYRLVARDISVFDTNTEVKIISQENSDSYFKGLGYINGILTEKDFITFCELDFISESISSDTEATS